jgi:hypothetical protein
MFGIIIKFGAKVAKIFKISKFSYAIGLQNNVYLDIITPNIKDEPTSSLGCRLIITKILKLNNDYNAGRRLSPSNSGH